MSLCFFRQPFGQPLITRQNTKSLFAIDAFSRFAYPVQALNAEPRNSCGMKALNISDGY